jgi:hypothetical protein
MPVNPISRAGAERIYLVNGSEEVMVNISGRWSGTLAFDLSGDGVAWSQAKPATTTRNGHWIFPTAGWRLLRVRASAWESGTAKIEAARSVEYPAELIANA